MEMADRNPSLIGAAQLVRRATLGNDQDLVKELAPLSRSAAVDSLLDTPLDTDTIPAKFDDDYKGYEKYLIWWVNKCASPKNPLQEKMAWFFHTFLTSHRGSVGGKNGLVATQLDMFRAKSLGNFRDLLQAFVIDGALIRYLNADSNTGRKPNENLARELMELFTTGLGQYTENDIREASKAISGWRVDNDEKKVVFDPKRAYGEPVTFMGETKKWDVASIVDRLCDHEATAEFVVSKLWYYLAGGKPPPADVRDLSGKDGQIIKELAVFWREKNLEMKPLIKKILNHPELNETYYSRPRSGFEYYMALHNSLGLDIEDGDKNRLWRIRNIGQLPYSPPNVAGWPDEVWPDGYRWLSQSALLARYPIVTWINFEKEVPGGQTASVDEILDRCGIHKISDKTLELIKSVKDDNIGERGAVQAQWLIALFSWEFALI